MKKRIKSLIGQTPILSKIVSNVRVNQKYKNEIDLYNGKILTKSSKKSVIHFSVNKAATQYVKTLLHELALNNDLIPIDFNAYAFETEHPYLDHLSKDEIIKYKHIFKPNGYVYSVFGGVLKNIDDFNAYDIILSVRDPRDILVSSYYSTAFSHDVPPITSNKREAFLQKRELTKKIGIDQFVIDESVRVYSVFNNYRNMLNKIDNRVSVVKYEDMITNYESWLNDLVSNTNLKLNNGLKESFVDNYNKSKIKKENKYSHNRKGKSGDYKEKLQDSTIQYLNEKFGALLEFYGYKIQ